MTILSLLALLLGAAEALRAPCLVPSRPAVALRMPSAPVASAVVSPELQPSRFTLPAIGPRVRSTALLALSLGLASAAPALASASAAGEHLHLGQKIALFFQRPVQLQMLRRQLQLFAAPPQALLAAVGMASARWCTGGGSPQPPGAPALARSAFTCRRTFVGRVF